MIDTGSTSTLVDFSVAQAYWAQVDGAVDTAGDGSAFTHPCNAALPDFGFYVNGNLLTIPGHLLTGFESGNSKTFPSLFVFLIILFEREKAVVENNR